MQQMNPLGMMEYFKFLQENAARKLHKVILASHRTPACISTLSILE